MKQWFVFHATAIHGYGGHYIAVKADSETDALRIAKTDPRVSGPIKSEPTLVRHVDLWENAINWKARVYVNDNSIEIQNIQIAAQSSSPLIALPDSIHGTMVGIKRLVKRGPETYYAEWPSYYIPQHDLSRLTVGSAQVIVSNGKLDFYKFGETVITGMSILDKSPRARYIERIKEQALQWVEEQLDRHIIHLNVIQQSLRSSLKCTD